MRRNIILHYEAGTSDKVYIVSVVKKSSGYQVVTKWGRRGRENLNSQVKGTFPDELAARYLQGEIVNEKIGKGYQDIESSSYRGSVRTSDLDIIDNLEKDDGITLMEVFNEEAREKNRTLKGETEMVCVDNSGIEDGFDRGVTYICEPHSEPTVRLSVMSAYDKLGNKRDVLLERFERIDKKSRKALKYNVYTKQYEPIEGKLPL